MPETRSREPEIELINLGLGQAGHPHAIYDPTAQLVPRHPGSSTDIWLQLAASHNPTHSRLIRVMLYQYVWVEVYDCGAEFFPDHYHLTYRYPGNGTCLNGIIRAHCRFEPRTQSIKALRADYEAIAQKLIDSMLFGDEPAKIGFAYFRLDGAWNVEVLRDRLTRPQADKKMAQYDENAFFFYLGDRMKKAHQTDADLEREVMDSAQEYLFSWMQYYGIKPSKEAL